MVEVEAADVDVFSVTPNGTFYFKATLKAPASRAPISFTLNYTLPTDKDKKWVNHEFQTTDGLIVFRTPVQVPDMNSGFSIADRTTLHTYFSQPLEFNDNNNVNVSVTSKFRTTNQTAADPQVWVYNFDVPRGKYDSSPGYVEALLGSPVGDSIVSYFSIVKHGTAWIHPYHPRSRGSSSGRFEGFHPPKEAVMVAFLTSKGEVLVFLPVSFASSTVYLKGDDSGRIVAVGRNDGDKSVQAEVVVVLARDVEEGVEEAMYWLKRINKSETGEVDEKKEAALQGEEDPWSDALKYCTWNSMGRELSHKRVINAVNDLYDNGINVETVIIDDNWQSQDNYGRDNLGHRMTEFEADKTAFPQGLKGLVQDIKNKNKGVKHVAVWHGILGYWNGVSPNGWIAKNYKLRNVSNGALYVVDKEDIGRFLYAQGITAVKADTQCLLDERLPSADKGVLFPAYLAAWRTAASKWFGTRAISCMSLLPQVLYTNHLSPSLPKFTLRNSDDYFPHSPTSHPWHIFSNAHNGVFSSRLNVTPDWDMFQTKHDWGSYHAAARCISGGPVYITDEVGSHDLSVIKQITAKGRNGEAVILRPNGVARSLEFFTGFNEGRPVKIINTTGPDGYKIKLVGTFDLDGGKERTDMISMKDVVGASDFVGEDSREKEYAVFSHNSQSARLVGAESYIKTTVEKFGWDVTSISPTVPVKTDGGSGEVRIAVFGLLEQISGAAAVKDVKIASGGTTVKVGVELKALGIFGKFFYLSSYSRCIHLV
ncbi:Alpha-galactosidase [Dactylellina cionopaga]|nr:Alpha-galactosidase [Dactylellina cionopaga]